MSCLWPASQWLLTSFGLQHCKSLHSLPPVPAPPVTSYFVTQPHAHVSLIMLVSSLFLFLCSIFINSLIISCNLFSTFTLQTPPITTYILPSLLIQPHPIKSNVLANYSWPWASPEDYKCEPAQPLQSFTYLVTPVTIP